MKKTLVILAVIAACLFVLWLLRHKEQSEPIELVQQPLPVAKPEDTSAEEGIGLLAFLKGMADKPAPEEPAEPESAETPNALQGGAIAGHVYDAISDEGIKGAIVYAVLDGKTVASSEKTDSSGDYRIADLADNTYEVRYKHAQGYPEQNPYPERRVTISGGQSVEGIDFALIPGVRVAGKVVDRQRLPVEGASVDTHMTSRRDTDHPQSQADGSFELYLFRPINGLRIQAWKDSLMSKILGPLDVPVEGVEGLVLELAVPLTASISGVVVDPTGRPIADAEVNLAGDQTVYVLEAMRARQAKTIENGSFTIGDMAPGEYRISGTAPASGYLDLELTQVELKEGQALTGLRLVLGADKGGLAIAGRVEDTAGKPIAEARVMCSGGRGGPVETISLADGSFRVSGLEETEYMLWASHKDYSPRAPFARVQAGSKDVVVVVQGTGDIEGRVLRADTGQPLTNFQVYRLDGHRTRVDPRVITEGRTVGDAEGRFKFTRLRPGDHCIVARALGFAPGFLNLTVKENETLSDVELRLQPGQPLVGRVVNAAQQPVSGAMISLGGIYDSYWPRDFVAKSDSNGAFIIEDFSPDFRWVFAYHPSYPPGVSQVSNNTTIVMQNASKLEGRVDRGGSPVAGIDVWLEYPETGPPMLFPRSVKTDVNGTFSFKDLVPGIVRLRAGTYDGRSLTQTAVLEPGQTTRVELIFESARATLEGRITIHGEPPEQASVYLQISTLNGEENRGAGAQLDGTYRVEGLPAGEALMRIQARTRDRMRHGQVLKITIVEGEVYHQDIDFIGEGQITGRVLGIKTGSRGYVEVLHGEVEIPETPAWRKLSSLSVVSSNCDPDGSYQIQHLEPGTYTLVAMAGAMDSDPSEMPFASRVVTIQGNETVNVDFDLR